MGMYENRADGFDGRVAELAGRFRAGTAPWPESDFERSALDVFRHQYEGNDAYRAFCDLRGITPDNIGGWRDAPAVPATAFKHLDLVSVPGSPEAVFLTSGTTGGAERRGRHAVPRLELYRASLAGPFHRYVLGGESALPFVSLIPSRNVAPHSSLSFMVDEAAEQLAPEIHHLVDADGRMDVEALLGICERSADAHAPVLLVGTALSFVHLFDRLGERSMPKLAEGSKLMETGGFKGLDRDVSRASLYRELTTRTGLAADRIVNEYGMTELLSQLYEPVLEEGASAAGVHVPPPWLRVHAVEPATLHPLPEGASGLLTFFDLANAGSISHVLTQDVGHVSEGRVHLRGRAEGADPRGCSRAVDELLSVAGAG